MDVKKAIKLADDIRPNTILDEQKAIWLMQLEGQVADVMELPAPENKWPDNQQLLMPQPYETIYQYFLCAMIDFVNLDMNMYAVDMAMFNSEFGNATAYWRRHNKKKNGVKGWKM